MRKGFTLVELLIVILIIGILAAVVAPRFIQMDRNARIAATKANLQGLRAAINLYRGDRDAYPDAPATQLVPTYIEKLPSEKVTSNTGTNTAITVLTTDGAFAAAITSVTSGWIYGNFDSGTYGRAIHCISKNYADSAGAWPHEW